MNQKKVIKRANRAVIVVRRIVAWLTRYHHAKTHAVSRTIEYSVKRRFFRKNAHRSPNILPVTFFAGTFCALLPNSVFKGLARTPVRGQRFTNLHQSSTASCHFFWPLSDDML